MSVPHVLLISLQKCGTHMVSSILGKLGFSQLGAVFGDPPNWSEAEMDRVMGFFYSPRQIKWMKRLRPKYYRELRHNKMYEILFLWYERLGSPMASRNQMSIMAELKNIKNRDKLLTLPFESIPAPTAVVLHELPLGDCDGEYLRQWNAHGLPITVFNYRDPRDVIISFINYLSGNVGKGFSAFSEYHIYNRILGNLPDMDSRLMYAIKDPNFPGHRDFAEHLWMLKHPFVCNLSYEELVGEEGGGSDEARAEAIKRLFIYLHLDQDPVAFSKQATSKKSATFNKGKIGVWREVFKDEHHQAFNERFGEITKLYGYDLYTPGAVNVSEEVLA